MSGIETMLGLISRMQAVDTFAITVSVPYYGYEFNMSWNHYSSVPLSILLADSIDRASQRRYSTLIQQPTFTLTIPGRPTPSLDAIVSTVVSPGDLILIVTDEETVQRSNPAPNISTLVQNAIIGGLSRMYESRNTPFTTVRLPGHNASQSREVTHEVDEEDDEEDEEMTLPLPDPTRAQREETFQHALMTMSNLIAGRPIDNIDFTHLIGSGAPDPGATNGNVRTVLNMETYQKVCHLVTAEEISKKTTVGPAVQVDDPENDTIGGSQDAGLGACSICLTLLVNRIKTPGDLRKMPNCSHIFHTDCLGQWLTHNAITCPVCREPAVTDPKDYGFLGYGLTPEVYVSAVDLGIDSTRRHQMRPVASRRID